VIRLASRSVAATLACLLAGAGPAAIDAAPIAPTSAAIAPTATATAAPASAATATSHAELWTAIGGNVTCGVATHPVNSPPMQLLCSARHVPPPKAKGVGDPGFVFLGSTGRPSLARLSQDSFVGTKAVALKTGRKWSGGGPIVVTCTITARAVHCTNHAGHGFVMSKRSYRSY
jgi:hypothetical protein